MMTTFPNDAPAPARSRVRGLLLSLDGLLAAGLSAVFVAYALALVARVGVCCADDAFIAHAAKNLAGGLGYASSIQAWGPEYGLVPFDPIISTGPTVLLPAAALMKLFGPTHWAPGLALVLFWSAALAAAAWILRREVKPGRLLLGASVFFGCAVGLFALHLEHWFALLGEVPSACLLLLAALLIDGRSDAHRRVAAAGAFLGLAILTKLIAAVYAPAFFGVLLLRRLRDAGLAGAARTAAVAGAGVAAPLALFEAWKLAALGARGYDANFRAMLSFVRQGSGDAGRLASLAEHVGTRVATFSERFGALALPVVATALVLALWYGVRGRGDRGGALAFLATGTATHLAYWLLFSNGWPRYFLVGVFLVCAALALLVLVASPRAALVAACIAAVLVVPSRERIRSGGNFGAWPGAPHGLDGLPSCASSPKLAALGGAAAYIARRRGGTPVGAQWWAAVADLEYTLPGAGHFQPWETLRPRCEREGCLVSENRRFLLPRPEYDAFVKGCGPPAYDVDDYRVYECRPRAPAAP